MSFEGHLGLDQLEPGAIDRLPPEARAHLERCARCRVEARMLARVAFDDAPSLPRGRSEAPSVEVPSAATADEADIPTLLLETFAVEPEAPRVIRALGSGPNGAVFEVRDGQSGQRLAMKVLSVPAPADRARLEARLEQLGRVMHPHVVRPRFWSTAARQPWIVMPFLGANVVAGAWNAVDWLKPANVSPPTPLRVRGLAADMAAGLQALHGAGLAHGALLPNNVLLDAAGRAVICDAFSSHAADADPNDDWAALGSLLVELMTQDRPRLDGPPVDDLLRRVRTAYSRPLADLCRALLDPDRTSRAAAAEVFAAVGHASPSPRPVSPPSPGEGIHGLAATPSTEVQPVRIGPYRIVEPLGAGGMGFVYRAEHAQSGLQVALKTVRTGQPRLAASLRAEIRALASLDHPGVARILDEGEVNGMPWYAMALVEGMPLLRYAPVIRWRDSARTGGPLNLAALDELLRAVIRIADILGHLHAAGLVHRDLKPDNVLVRPSGEPILVDFGLAVQHEGAVTRQVLERHPGLGGSVPYMAPEQIRGEFVDARADLYGLGCVLVHVLAGRPPFLGSTPLEVMSAHLRDAPPLLEELVPGVPTWLAEEMGALLAKSPQERTPFAWDLRRRLTERVALAYDRDDVGAGPSYVYNPELVGRDAPLARLDARLSRLSLGTGALVVVAGEAGAGGTRLVKTWLRRIEPHVAEVLVGSGTHGGTTPFGALRGPFDDLAARCHQGGPTETERLLGREGRLLARHVSAWSDLPGLDALHDAPPEAPVDERPRLFRAVTRIFERLASEGAVVLVLDDLHDADGTTLGWLDHLVRGGGLAQSPLLVVGIARRESEPPVLAGLSEHPSVERLSLERLATAQVRAMIASMLATRSVPQELCDRIYQRSEGNPLFVAALVRDLVTAGLLVRDAAGGWRVTDGSSAAALVLPVSWKALSQRRLEPLGPAARRLLEAAAVLRRDIAPPALSALVGDPGLDGLDELLRHQILEQQPSGDLRFTHGTLADVVYEDLPEPRRQALHRASARWLAALPDPGPGLAECARHWERGGEGARARQTFLAAAARAVELVELSQAEHLLANAQRLGDDLERGAAARIERTSRSRPTEVARHRPGADETPPAEPLSLLQSLVASAEVSRARGDIDSVRRHLEQARQHFLELDLVAHGPPHGSQPRRHNLPRPLTGFVGRRSEIEAIHALFASRAALVSVTGPGGMGKTRLAQEFGSASLTHFPGGVWFADLTEARSEIDICAALARALDVPLAPRAAVQQLANVLGGYGRCLVIFDNFEQVVEHAAATVGVWLGGAPELAVLVTSREVLRIGGERAVSLEPLPTPEHPVASPDDLLQYDAVRLFVERARAAQRDFSLGAENAEDVAELVRLLDGMPLAIELAAARVRVLGPRTIRNRMVDRFQVLRGDRRDRPDRQATLRGAIDWSWVLLRPWEQFALAQCAVFQGGFGLEAAESVIELEAWPEAPWAVDVVQALVEKSLLRVWTTDGSNEPRFGMYAAIAAYAEERLANPRAFTAPDGRALGGVDARTAAWERHARYYASFGDDARLEGLHATGSARRFAALAVERENLRAAVERAVASGWGQWSVQAVLALSQIAQWRGPLGLALEASGQVMAMAGLAPPWRLRLLQSRGFSAVLGGEQELAEGVLQEALELARSLGDRRYEGRVRGTLGDLHQHRGDLDPAHEHFSAALAIAREVGDRRREGIGLGYLGLVEQARGRNRLARQHLEAALAILESVDSPQNEGYLRMLLGIAESALGEGGAALASHEAALLRAREVSDRRLEGYALSNLAAVNRELGRLEATRERAHEARAIARQLGDRRLEGYAELSLADLALTLGDRDAADRHAAALGRAAGAARDRRLAVEVSLVEGRRLLASGVRMDALGHLERALAQAAVLEDAVFQGRARTELGVALSDEGRTAEATDLLRRAVAELAEAGDGRLEGMARLQLARTLHAGGEPDQAKAEVAAALSRLREAGAEHELAAAVRFDEELRCGAKLGT